MKQARFLAWLGAAALSLVFAGAARAQIPGGFGGLPQKFDPQALEQMAQRGDPDAQFELGLRLLGGEGFPKDEKKAAEWITKAADQKHPDAIYALATMYEEGAGVAKDEKKAFDLYKKAADMNLALAQQNLAECFDTGKGVAKDEKKAAEWFLKAAQQKLPTAQAAYGMKLEKGTGVAKNTSEAANWMLKAAQQGLVAAMTHLAYMYYTGIGVPLDYRRAEAWYRLAARSENPWAHNDLAWFLSTCPDDSFHDPDTAIEFARSAVGKLSDRRYEAIDTLAAALARSGKYGEAVQTQMKAIVLLGEEKSEEVKGEDRSKLEKELSERLGLYKKAKPFTESQPKPEAGMKPMVEDRILQDQEMPRRKKKPKVPDDSHGVVS